MGLQSKKIIAEKRPAKHSICFGDFNFFYYLLLSIEGICVAWIWTQLNWCMPFVWMEVGIIDVDQPISILFQHGKTSFFLLTSHQRRWHFGQVCAYVGCVVLLPPLLPFCSLHSPFRRRSPPIFLLIPTFLQLCALKILYTIVVYLVQVYFYRRHDLRCVWQQRHNFVVTLNGTFIPPPLSLYFPFGPTFFLVDKACISIISLYSNILA